MPINLYLNYGHMEKVYKNVLAERLKKAGLKIIPCAFNIWGFFTLKFLELAKRQSVLLEGNNSDDNATSTKK